MFYIFIAQVIFMGRFLNFGMKNLFQMLASPYKNRLYKTNTNILNHICNSTAVRVDSKS